MRCAGLTCKKRLFIPALVLVVLAVTGIAFNFRGCKSVKLNFPSCNSSNVNDLLANATSNWIKALDSYLTWKLKVTIEITKKLLSSKPTAASEWRDTNLTLVPSSEGIPSISYIHSSAFSRVSLSSKVLSLIKFSTPVADSTETFLSAPCTSTFTSSLFNRFTIGNSPSGSSPTSVPNAPSGPLFDHSLPPNEATASAQSPIQPVIALVSSPANSSPQTYMHPISSVYPSTLHLSSASVPYFLPHDQTSKSPTFFAPPAAAKTSILQSYLSPLHVSPISITLLGEPSRESSQHAHRGPSSPFSYSALTPLNGGSMPPQVIQSSAQILSPADVHPPKQAPSPLTSPIFSETKPPSAFSSFPSYSASSPVSMNSISPHYTSSPNLPPISSTPTAEPPGGLSRHASTGSTFSYPSLTPSVPSEEDKSLPPQLPYSSARTLSPAYVHYSPQVHSPLTSSISKTTKPPSVIPSFVTAATPVLIPRMSSSLSYPILASPSSSLPVPSITLEVAHIGAPSSKSSPVLPLLQPVSALKAPSFFNIPSPSNAKSPDSSLAKSRETYPVMSHAGSFPVPFTFSANTLSPTFSPLHGLDDKSLPPQQEVSSLASPSPSQAVVPVVPPTSVSLISPQSSNLGVPFPQTLSPGPARKSEDSPSQQAKTNSSASSPSYLNEQFSPQQAPLSGFFNSQPNSPPMQASAPPHRSSSNSPVSIRSPDSYITPSPALTPPSSNSFSYSPLVGPATDTSSSSVPPEGIYQSSPKTPHNISPAQGRVAQGSSSLPFQPPSIIASPSFFHSMPPSLGHALKSTSPTPLQNPLSLPSPSNLQTSSSASPPTVSPVLGRTSYPVPSTYSPLPIHHTPSTIPVTKDIYSPSLQPPLYVASPNILHSQPPSLASKAVSVLAPHQAPSISSPPTQPLPPTSSISVREKHALSPSELSFRVPAPSLHPHTISKPLVAPLHSIHHYPVFPPLLGRKSPLPAIVDWPPSFQISPVVAPEPQMFGDNSRTSSQHSLKRNAHRPQAPLPMHGINSEVPPTSTPHASTSPTTDLRPRHLQQPRAPLQPAPVQENATAPSPPKHDSAHVVPIMSPMKIYFPPPPNSDCHQTCVDPYTSTPPGSACGCVLPMLVGLELGTTLYSLFPLVSELAQEVAEGAFLSPSQVHIMGANTVSDNLDKTEVEADMVPLGLSFDHTTAVFIAQRFWSHQVFINETLFGNYSVLYIKYPGLPPSPPSRNSVGPNSGKMKGGNEASYSQPLSVDVAKSNSRLSDEILAIVMISCIIAAITFVGVKWLFFLRSSHYRMHPALIKPAEGSSMSKRTVLSSSLGSSESMSFASSLTANGACSKKFTLAELVKATKNFRRENVIGEGGFGRVYRGTLEDSTKVAVKVLTRDDEQGVREFAAEVEMLSRLHHRNLVKLVGTCIEENVRCLVYELIPNGSVEFHLHGDHKRPAPLSWEVRLKIALGSARGLAYLHEDSNPRVIHRDFKSSNILLENDFNPKVSDFGLAKAASDEVGGHVSTRVMGTFGYVAPEYAMTGHLLVKSDVYSYGVVLLELLSGRKPVNISGLPGEENLVTWARPLLRSKEGLKTLGDPNLGDDVPFHNFLKVAAIASMCVHPEVAHRPFMGEVVQALKLVYNDSETSDGAPSRNNSLSAEFPLRNHDSKTTPVDALRSSLIYLPDDSSFITVDYDSGPLDTPNEDFKKPSSASAILSNSGRFIKQISGSFRNSSGPLKIVRSNPEWYRFGHALRDSVSEHGMDMQGTVKYHTDIWP